MGTFAPSARAKKQFLNKILTRLKIRKIFVLQPTICGYHLSERVMMRKNLQFVDFFQIYNERQVKHFDTNKCYMIFLAHNRKIFILFFSVFFSEVK